MLQTGHIIYLSIFPFIVVTCVSLFVINFFDIPWQIANFKETFYMIIKIQEVVGMAKTITLRCYRMCLRKYTNQKGNYYVWGNLLTKYKWAMQVNFSWLRVEWITVIFFIVVCFLWFAKDHKIETVSENCIFDVIINPCHKFNGNLLDTYKSMIIHIQQE